MKFLRYIAARATYDVSRSLVRNFQHTNKFEKPCPRIVDHGSAWFQFGQHLRFGFLVLAFFFLLTFICAGAVFFAADYLVDFPLTNKIQLHEIRN
jgi:hypothetical protein